MPRADANFNIGAKDLSGKAFKSIWKSMKKTQISVTSLNSAIVGLGTSYIGLRAAQKGLDLSSEFIAAGDASERYRIQLEQLLGSQEQANQVFLNTQEYAKGVSFTYQEAMDAASRFSGIVSDPTAIQQMIEITGDLAAVGRVTFDQAAQQMVRMWSAGAGSADLFRERGITAMLGFQAGVSYTAEETQQRVIEEFNKIDSKFRGTSKRLAETWSGLMSMFSDRWFQFRDNLMKAGLLDFLKISASEVLKDIDQFFEDNKNNYKTWADVAENAIISVAEAGAWLVDQIRGVVRFLAVANVGFVQLSNLAKERNELSDDELEGLEEKIGFYKELVFTSEKNNFSLDQQRNHEETLNKLLIKKQKHYEAVNNENKELIEAQEYANKLSLEDADWAQNKIEDLKERINLRQEENKHQDAINMAMKEGIGLIELTTQKVEVLAKERLKDADDLINKYKVELGLRKELTNAEELELELNKNKYQGITQGQEAELMRLAKMKDDADELMKILRQPVTADPTIPGFETQEQPEQDGNWRIQQIMLEEQARLESIERLKAAEGEFIDWKNQSYAQQQESFVSFSNFMKNFEQATWSERIQGTVGFLGSIAGLMSGHSKKAFKTQKLLALSSAAVEGYQAATAAWKNGMIAGGPFGGFPLAAAYAGASLLKTAGLIKSIKSQKFGGGSQSSSSGGGGVPSASTGATSAIPTDSQLPTQSKPTTPTNIIANLPNKPWLETDAVSNMLESIVSRLGDDYSLTVNRVGGF